MMKLNRYLVVASIFFLGACDHRRHEVVIDGPIMGTDYHIKVVSNNNDETAIELLRNRVLEAMEAVNQSMSTYLPTSEISRFNLLPSGAVQELSPALYEVVNEALQISQLSGGAFDVTLGKAIRLWGFSEGGTISMRPDESTLEQLKSSVGFRYLRLEGRKLTKLADGLELNLSAIAKGYAVDKVAEAIEQLGFTDYLVDIGGELRANGKNLANQTWRVGIEMPHLMGGLAQVVILRSQAIATSGDYRNFLVVDGEQFSHTLDSRTLEPVYHKLASVSVLSSKASTADALATALLAMGEARGVTFAEQEGIDAYFIIRGKTEGNFIIHATEGFRANLPE